MLDAEVDANDGRGKIMEHIGAGHFDNTLTDFAGRIVHLEFAMKDAKLYAFSIEYKTLD